MTDWKMISIPIETYARLKALKKPMKKKSFHAVINELISRNEKK